MNPYPPLGNSEDVIDYLRSLQEGEEVIDCSNGAMYGCRGVVYIKDNNRYVKWSLGENWGQDSGKTMSTSVTWGTRRLKDVEL